MENIQIIAEIGQAHEGSLGIAHSYIDALKLTGINAIKFQTHIAHAESSAYEPFRVNFSYEDKCRYDYWKRMEFTIDEWVGLKNHCDEIGVEFISSPFSLEAVDLLEKLDVKRYKIGSGEVNNLLLLKKIGLTKKPIIISSGMSELEELDKVIKYIRNFHNEISILQCTTAYPTLPGEWGFDTIPLLKQRFNLPVGYSDHSGKTYPLIAAMTLGAELLEFHVVFDRRMFGPDSKSSLIIDEVKYLVNAIRDIERDRLLFQGKTVNENTLRMKKIFGKSLAINHDMQAYEILRFEDLEAKKPSGYGIDAQHFETVIGQKLNKNLVKGSFLNEQDLI